MPARRVPLLLIGAFIALYLIWGSTYLAIRIGVESWPPLLMAGIRFVVAGALMYGFLRWRGVPNPSWQEWKSAAAIGFLLLSCGNGGVTLAEDLGVASGVAALAVATVPLFALLLGLIWGQRTTRLEWSGILLGLVGIGLLNLGSNLQASPLGAVLIIFAAAAWSFGSMWSKNLKLPAGPMASAVEMLAGGVALLAGSLLSGERMVAAPTAAGWGALVYLIVFGSIIAFSSYLYLLKNVRPAAATSYAYVNPVVAVLLGIGFAGETVGIEEGLAMLVIIGAVVLIGLPQWRERKEEQVRKAQGLQEQTN
ncbi:drug/metabolite exporter YedA [Pseudomonas sp. BN417]|uniref:drug/metabolite exporter YedA n=1 Tax=Pseudomonas sp. BN417 TaxID=2567890 RepID=UPI0024586AEE|nr:drug/metabolite exporter YedA [Pseudomonas sp. BN417]MDH4556659.1 drug/metabolite exporter YedA [Pseudomonas sp. BN417]